MYSSYGLSGRVGVGFRRGHGGRDYRPPPRRKNNNVDDGNSEKIPPPLKQCHCLVQLDLPEYLQEASVVLPGVSPSPVQTELEIGGSSSSTDTRRRESTADVAESEHDGRRRRRRQQQQQQQQRARLHLCFEPTNGRRRQQQHDHHHQQQQQGQSQLIPSSSAIEERRQYLKLCETRIRSKYGCHLVVPGKNQKGPVAVVGKTYHDTIRATSWLLRHITLIPPLSSTTTTTTTTSHHNIINGRIQLDVQDSKHHGSDIINGQWSVFRENHHYNDEPHQHDSRSLRQRHSELKKKKLKPYWLFESERWSVMTCVVSPNSYEIVGDNENAGLSGTSTSSTTSNDHDGNHDNRASTQTIATERHKTATPVIAPSLAAEGSKDAPGTSTPVCTTTRDVLDLLSTCVDDIRFQLGNNSFDGVDIFFDDNMQSIIIDGNDHTPSRVLAADFSPASLAVYATGGHSLSSLEVMKRLFSQIQDIEIEL